MQPPPIARSHRIRTGWIHWIFAAPAIFLFILGFSLMFDLTSEQTGGERGIEQSLAIVALIAATAFFIVAMTALLLRPFRCATCQTKVHRRALSCSTCHAEFL
jgi:Ni,Fe-hydrogenase I cytochrome b subunit